MGFGQKFAKHVRGVIKNEGVQITLVTANKGRGSGLYINID